MRTWMLFLFVACASSAQPRRLRLIDAPAGEIEPIISRALAQAAAAQESLLVYVGAPWCPPCRTFQAAAAAGRLDDRLGAVRLLVFDADRDGDVLERAGYRSNQIPLFVVPRVDGRSSGQQIAGAFNDRDAVEQLVPQLTALLAR